MREARPFPAQGFGCCSLSRASQILFCKNDILIAPSFNWNYIKIVLILIFL
ncbi:hypothetical protein GJA_1453 [Janthinobacterium agaricidamnosum NBRC 102515 = DSM 9628]|uniref:Uncharacterized protein n=1 Tax=Janthinobacterium agaricidamnosum NBRC 102515 = DSM 9628 TaxID=1349767 RepID=W0UZV3_9BURK|nr:hypothetical protein GJA_1453 [Janthinobacterium agaricidamnosum NBRC 102515 = DSM 9628]